MKIKWTAAHSLALSRILTAVVLAFACAGLICIPIITEWYDAVSEKEPIHIVLNIILYLTDILGIAAVFALLRMLGRIAKCQVFVEANTRSIRLISWCCFGIAVLWLALAQWRLLALFVALIAAFAGLILRVMKNIFAMAVSLREENDYTI